MAKNCKNSSTRNCLKCSIKEVVLHPMSNPKIALVKAGWHDEIVGQCIKGFTDSLDAGIEVETVTVPGSLEIPLMAQKMAESGNFAAVCCVGFVTDGSIYRHEFVAHAVLNGMMDVQLKTGIPVLSAVLTPQKPFAEDGSNPEQYQFYFDHMVLKGEELAHSCMKTLELYA